MAANPSLYVGNSSRTPSCSFTFLLLTLFSITSLRDKVIILDVKLRQDTKGVFFAA